MKNQPSGTSPYRTIRLVIAMALGVVAILALPSLAAAKDRNNDRIPDRWEKRHNLSLKVKQTKRDQDSDHLKNLGEFHNSTNPRDADSDNDGIVDGKEAAVGDDPADDDSDDDGVEDGDENAGTVASFDGTTLTINLAAGGSISGLVTDQTRIKCEDNGDDSGEEPSGTDRSGRHRFNSGEEGSGDHSGDDDSGDDDGDHGDCENSCSVDDLVEGAIVHEAEIHLGGDGAVFKKIELEVASTPVAT